MREILKTIDGYNEKYLVSNLGNVFINRQGKISRLKQSKHKIGYLVVVLIKDKVEKSFLVHRLVANAFIRNPHSKQEVNHIDENKKNNKVDNLEWCTHKENMQHNDVIKKIGIRNSMPVIQYDLSGKFIKEYSSALEAQRQTGISNSNINEHIYGKKGRKHAGGYLWKHA